MTQEEKAKRYDEALERAKISLDDKTISDIAIAYIKDIFPELAESEDERIANAIKKLLDMEKSERNLTRYFGVSYQEAAAWLEKQGEKPKWTEEDSLMIDSIIDTMKWLEGKGATDMKIDWLKTLKQRML